jgi:hypothetical protein
MRVRTRGIVVRRGIARAKGGRLYVDGWPSPATRLDPDRTYHLAMTTKGETLMATARTPDGWAGLVIGQPGLIRRARSWLAR